MFRHTTLLSGLLGFLLASAWHQTSEGASDAQINSAIQKARAYIQSNFKGTEKSGEASLCLYAMLKSGLPVSDPLAVQLIGGIQSKVANGTYKPVDEHNGVYEAGADLMALEAVHNEERYSPAMLAIANYLISTQLPSGGWYYGHATEGAEARAGDTSISQYAILGLWAAHRANIKFDLSVLDRAAQWHLSTFQADSGFAYHPGKPPAERPSTHTMTAGGGGSVMMIRQILFPNYQTPSDDPPPSQQKGPLQAIDLDKPDQLPPGVTPPQANLKTSLASLNQVAAGTTGWLARRWTVTNPTSVAPGYAMYYLYALERFGALADVKTIGGHDWYQEVSDYLVTVQTKDGSWAGLPNLKVTAAFGILFLSRATGKTLNRVPAEPAGSGLLMGERGLPDNLGEIKVKNGEIQQEKITSPLDQLLADLANPDITNMGAVQEAVIEQVQIGDREALIKQKDLLVKLVKHPDVQVRRTAYWALGRCDDLGIVTLLIAGLDDPDLGVAVEARNALCILTRRPRGFGETDDPLLAVGESAPEPEKLVAAQKWRETAKTRWKAWHFSTRPYNEQDDFSELIFKKP